MKYFILLIAVLMFVGCGSTKLTFHTNVTSFHSMGSDNNPSAFSGKTFHCMNSDFVRKHVQVCAPTNEKENGVFKPLIPVRVGTESEQDRKRTVGST